MLARCDYTSWADLSEQRIRLQPPPRVPPRPLAPLGDTAAVVLPAAGFWIRMAALLVDALVVSIPTSLLERDGPHLHLLILAVYGAAMWKLKGATIGCMVFDLRVVRQDGRPIDWETAIVRALGCFLSLAVAGLGFFWIAVDQAKLAWHDKIAGAGFAVGTGRESGQTLAIDEAQLSKNPILTPGELHHVVVVEPAGLRTDGHAIDQRVIVFLAAVDVHDEIALGAARDRRDLYARAGRASSAPWSIPARVPRRRRSAPAAWPWAERVRVSGTPRRGAFGGDGLGRLIDRGADAANPLLALRAGLMTMVFSNSSCSASPSWLSTKRSWWWPTVITSPCCMACFLISLPLTYVPLVLFKSSRNESLRMLMMSE